MRNIVAAVVMTAMIVAAGCRGGAPSGGSGTPNPPFQGDPPQDKYVYQGEEGSYGGTLVLELPNDIRTLNVIRATDNISTYVLWYHVSRCLIDFRNGANPPSYDAGLVTKWESSPDATQWTFYMRRGVRWSDGEPFTAGDVQFTYDVIREESEQRRTDNAIRDVFIEGEDDAGKPIYPEFVKIDDYTVRFNLHKPNGSFLDAIYNLWLIPKHKWEQSFLDGTFREKMKVSDSPDDLVSLGPFRVTEYTTGQRVVLERNPYFWKTDKSGNRLPYLDRIVFVIARNAQTVNAKFQAGELDVTSRVRGEDYEVIRRMEGPDVHVEDIGVSYDTQFMAFNQNAGVNKKTGKPFVEPWKLRLFTNQKFRQAISYAIDREGLVNTAYAGRAMPIYSFVSPADKVWYSDDIVKYPYDKERARQMLAEIGLKDTNGDGLLEDPEGHTIEFSITTNVDNSQRTNTATFVARNLQDVGIKVNAVPVVLNTLIEMIQSVFNFDAVVLGWAVGVPPGPLNTSNVLLSSGLQHVCFPGQQNPATAWEARVDQIIRSINSSPDLEERKRMYAEVQRIWSEQLPEINLVSQKEAVAYKTKFGNMHPVPLPPRASWNCEEIYVKK